MRLRWWSSALAVVAVANGASAQTKRCNGEIISDISIVARAPYEALGTRWWEVPLRVATDLHVTTSIGVIRRFLIVKLGRPCIEQERAESERILRGQPYIADAAIAVLPDTGGTVSLLVETRDELTPIIGISASDAGITRLKLGEGNFLGSGMYLAGEWREGTMRDSYVAQAVHHQFLGRPYVLTGSVARRDQNMGDWLADLSHPFLTDIQRFAWRAATGAIREIFEFHQVEADRVPLAFERSAADVGAVMRIGPPGRLSLFGVSFSQEEDTPLLPPTPAPGVDYDSLFARYAARRNARVNALWAFRNLRFRRAERLEGLTGAQDLRLGFQLGTLIGRSLSLLNTTDDDFLVAADVYGGLGGPRGVVMLNARAEGRQNYDTNEWDGILGSARLVMIRRLSPRHTTTDLDRLVRWVAAAHPLSAHVRLDVGRRSWVSPLRGSGRTAGSPAVRAPVVHGPDQGGGQCRARSLWRRRPGVEGRRALWSRHAPSLRGRGEHHGGRPTALQADLATRSRCPAGQRAAGEMGRADHELGGRPQLARAQRSRSQP